MIVPPPVSARVIEGVPRGLTEKGTAAASPEVPLESMARAVRLTAPATVGVHAMLKGAALSVPMRTLSAKKSTRAIVTPTMLEVAAAVILTGVAMIAEAPAKGVVRATEGGTAEETVTATVAETTALPLSSVARANSEAEPRAAGVHAILHTPPTKVALPRAAPLTKTWTELIVPSGSAALRVMVVAEETGSEAPATGVRSATEGAVPITPTISMATGELVL